VVVGIKQGKLQVIKKIYEVIPTPKHLPLISYQDAVMEASMNLRRNHKEERNSLTRNTTVNGKSSGAGSMPMIGCPGQIISLVELIFFRAMKEVAPLAFTRTSHSSGQPLNWSPIECIE
jgi:hypothetical protein